MELRGKSWFARWFGHWTAPDVIRRELEAAGYRQVSQHDFLERQNFLIFEPAAGSGPPS